MRTERLKLKDECAINYSCLACRHSRVSRLDSTQQGGGGRGIDYPYRYAQVNTGYAKTPTERLRASRIQQATRRGVGVITHKCTMQE